MNAKTPIDWRASKARPCLVCGSGTKGCSVAKDGLNFCRGEPADPAAWKMVDRNCEWVCYRPADDAAYWNRKATSAPKNWPDEAAKFARDFSPARKAQLASMLGLPVEALDSIEMLGYTSHGGKDQHDAWVPAFTFPMRDGNGRIVGIQKRFTESYSAPGEDEPKNKRFAKGSTPGLVIPRDWRERPGPVLLVEGASDVIAVSHLGLAAIGRPSNVGGIEFLAELLAGIDRTIIVVGENDRKDSGQWPGRDGAEQTAATLAERLRRPVKWSMPPDGVKDSREWVQTLLTASGTGDDIVEQLQDRATEVKPSSDNEPSASTLRLSIGQLMDDNPRLHEPLIEGLLRCGESVNIISTSKIGKSWLAYGLLLSFVTRRPWLSRFHTVGGRALLIDNELHRATLANRIKTVAQAMEIDPAQYRDAIEVLPIRGKGLSIFDLRGEFDRIRKGEFGLIVLDAKYRLLPHDTSENDNAAETRFFNEIDRIAESTGSGVANIHHASKGNQSDKRVTDVGAGAGAQSRAADSHLVLREHEEENSVVLEAAVRSFAPVQPIGLRWEYPLWVPDSALNTDALKGSRSRSAEEQAERDAEAVELILANTLMWTSQSQLHKSTGMSHPRISRAIRRLIAEGMLESQTQTNRGKDCEVYRRKA